VAFLVILGIFAFKVKKTTLRENLLRLGSNFLSGVTFKTLDSRGNEIVIKSDEICADQKDRYTLKNTASSFVLPNGESLLISANTAKIHTDETTCEFIGNVSLSTKSGLRIKTEHLLVDRNKKTASGKTKISISQQNIIAAGEEYVLDMNSNTFILINRAQCSLGSDIISADKLIIRFHNGQSKSVKSMDAIGNAVYITKGCSLMARNDIKYFEGGAVEARGAVVLRYRKGQESYDIQSDFMRAKIKDSSAKDVEAIGSLVLKTKEAVIRADRGMLNGDSVQIFGNVAISGEHGNIFGNMASLNIRTGEVFVNQSSGIIADRMVKR
jgi:LPS export ABC transporter protein LptC